MKTIYLYLAFLFFFWNILYAQEATIKDPYFQEIENKIIHEKDDDQKLKIAKQYLEKAKEGSNKLELANGYYLMSYYFSENSMKYADSLINVSKDMIHFKYPARGYITKGNGYYELANYKEALNQYLIASDYASKRGNTVQYLSIKFNIGLIKNNLGNREEALEVFKECVFYLEENNLQEEKVGFYIAGLYALSDAYTFIKHPDSSSLYVAKGIEAAIKQKNDIFYSYFVAHAGVNNFFLKNYESAIDSLKKGKSLLKRTENNEIRIATCDYYIARSLHESGEIEKSMVYFKKVDTVLRTTKDVMPDLIKTYTYLIDHYKSKSDIKNQILYINRLMKIDSIKDTNFKFLTKTINKEYDTRNLINQKEDLVIQLEKNKSSSSRITMFLITLTIILLLGVGYFLYRSYIHKKRFKELMELQSEKVNNPSLVKIEHVSTKSSDEDGLKDLGLSENVVNELLQKLEEFEKSNLYTKKQYTLSLLAKELETNNSYLSKIINVKKKISFAQYINNLRIECAVKELTKNSLLRSYTIKAISKEFGFNTAQSFTTAFHKNTGIYPSYFLKQLDSKG